MPRDLIPANLPVFYQCLALPVSWEAGVIPRKNERSATMRLSELLKAAAQKPAPDLLRVTYIADGKPTFFDPKEKRNEFFRLRRGDVAQLVDFLNASGLFESEASLFNVAGVGHDDEGVRKALTKTGSGDFHSVPYHPLHSANKIWDMRDAIVKWFESGQEFGKFSDFQVRISRENKEPKAVITTTTLIDAVLLSIVVDGVKKAKVQKCARHDCGILFTSDTRHSKKYCCRYCAHIESVRRDRERKREQGQPETKPSKKGRV